MADTHYDAERFVLLQERGDGDEPRVRPIHCPIAVVLGHYEKLTDEELEDHRADISAEIMRRNATL